MPVMRLIFACCGYLLAANSAQAYQYCGNLPKNSSAFYSCEALNQQERFEQDRKREAREQEEKRKQDQFFRDMDEKREREKREAQERSRYEQERTERAERTQSREKQEKMQMAAELLPIVGGVEAAKTALEAGKCDQAQRALDDLQPKIKNSNASYSMDGKVLTREDLENAFVALQSQVYVSCLTGPERMVKLLSYLERESKNGNKAAQELFTKTKDMMRAEIEKNSGQKGKNKNVPKFSDYGTDMASLHKYDSDLDETDVSSCREQWKNKDTNAAYCIAQQETGEKKIAMLREASKLGHPIAQNNLAMMLGEDRKTNSVEIVKLIKASAQQGIPHSQVTMGWWFMKGWHGIKIDYSEAMKWNLMAYKQGHSEGANNIGELYENGLGVPKDIEQAKSWYKKASVLGNAEATERLEKLNR